MNGNVQCIHGKSNAAHKVCCGQIAGGSTELAQGCCHKSTRGPRCGLLSNLAGAGDVGGSDEESEKKMVVLFWGS